MGDAHLTFNGGKGRDDLRSEADLCRSYYSKRRIVGVENEEDG